MMEEVTEVLQEARDQVGSLNFSPPPMKKSDTRDSMSSLDSDVSLSFDRRGSKGEEADMSDTGSSDCEKSKETKAARDSGVESFDDVAHKESDPPHLGSTKDILGPLEQDFVPPSEELADKICAQVEFYFSDENIVKDAFLLKHVKRNKEGYVSLKLISSFKRVKHLSRDWRVVGAALARSKKLQVNSLGTKLRRLDPLPQFDQTTPSRTILVARLPVDRLTVESVAEIFRPCGEIALIRVLRPGHPAPAEVRQAIAKRPELSPNEECAMVEFTDSASARNALRMTLDGAKLFELQAIAEKKRKQQQQQQSSVKKSSNVKSAKEEYNNPSYTSGSEMEDGRARHRKPVHSYPMYHVYPGHYQPGPSSPEPWLSRRLSSCSISGSENGFLLRRLSSCSNSSSDGGNYARRFSACSSGSENSFYHVYPGYCQQSRRHSCCSSSSSTDCGGNCFNPMRRGSADYGPFFRRLSACSRDSGFDAGSRRTSCSSTTEQTFFRPRSNSNVAFAHLPENVTRMPSGPDGTRGFGRPPRMNPVSSPIEHLTC
ncbi:la-related protein 6 [Prorops nasuta]|uniref:la-related protein 6 n=1 Tax=Prorops nasuta TaxID=863751 RepID=UPI0034CD10DB